MNTHLCLVRFLHFGNGGFHHSSPGLIISINNILHTHFPDRILITSLYFLQYLQECWEKAMAPHSVLLPGKSHGWRSLLDCSPWGREESDTTEGLAFHFSLSCIGERNGNPLQCSCLENPRDGGAWWDAIYGVAQSRTRLKWRSSSNKNVITYVCLTVKSKI